MSEQLLEWPLKIKSGKISREKGKTELTANIDDFIAQKIQRPAIVAAWLDNRVIWGVYEDGKISLSDDSQLEIAFLQELRVFNEDEELHIRINRQNMVWRYINDTIGEENIEYVDCMARLWGKATVNQGIKAGYTTLVDKERKISLTIPVTGKPEHYYGLVTRNYIEYDENTSQAGYRDYRYVTIKEAGRDK